MMKCQNFKSENSISVNAIASSYLQKFCKIDTLLLARLKQLIRITCYYLPVYVHVLGICVAWRKFVRV